MDIWLVFWLTTNVASFLAGFHLGSWISRRKAFHQAEIDRLRAKFLKVDTEHRAGKK